MSEYRGCIEHTAYDSGCDGCAEVQMVAAQSRDITDLTKQRDALLTALEKIDTNIHECKIKSCNCTGWHAYDPAVIARVLRQALAGQPERREASAHDASEAAAIQRIKDWSGRTTAAIEGRPDPQAPSPEAKHE